MSKSYISVELRRQVVNRAENLCEYCLIHEDDTFFGCHVDHVISEKHAGVTELGNLALSCMFCNLHKGSDIASITEQGLLVRLFNPRIDKWSQNFVLSGAYIEPLTDEGEVTARILRINIGERIMERQALIEAGRYPSEAAHKRVVG